MKPSAIAISLGCLLASSIALSFAHPWGNPRSGLSPNAPLMEGSVMPDSVRRVLEQKCADCHSGNTRWPLYGRLAPASWLIEGDVQKARSRLNMSQWPRYSRDSQIDLLTRIASEARSGEMPVGHYLILHPQARLSPQEQQLIYEWARAERKRMRASIAQRSDSVSSR